MSEQNPSGPVDRDVGLGLVEEGLWYFERVGDDGDKRYVAAIREELDRMRAQVKALRESLRIYVHAHSTGNSVPPHIDAAARNLLAPNARLTAPDTAQRMHDE